jgi:hypothetical protein
MALAQEALTCLGDTPLPGYARASALVRALHQSLPHLGVIGWDVMIDADAVPWLIEFNTAHPAITVPESTVGPCFLGLGWHELRLQPAAAPWFAADGDGLENASKRVRPNDRTPRARHEKLVASLSEAPAPLRVRPTDRSLA